MTPVNLTVFVQKEIIIKSGLSDYPGSTLIDDYYENIQYWIFREGNCPKHSVTKDEYTLKYCLCVTFSMRNHDKSL